MKNEARLWKREKDVRISRDMWYELFFVFFVLHIARRARVRGHAEANHVFAHRDFKS
jgi:hypothetical protein